MIDFKKFFQAKDIRLSSLSDEALLKMIAQKNENAFSVLVYRHADTFYKLAFRTLGHAQDAEDAVQESFLKLWSRPLWKDEKGAKFTTWFYRIVVNHCYDRLRKKQDVHVENFDDFVFDSFRIDEKIIKNEEKIKIEKAIHTLPQSQKTALNLSFYQGLKNREAAEVMNMGEKAFESLLFRAKENLKKSFKKQGKDFL